MSHPFLVTHVRNEVGSKNQNVLIGHLVMMLVLGNPSILCTIDQSLQYRKDVVTIVKMADLITCVQNAIYLFHIRHGI